MKIIDVWVLWDHGMDGRAPGSIAKVFSEKAVAETAKGDFLDIQQGRAVVLDDDRAYLLGDAVDIDGKRTKTKASLKAAAKAKLSDDEFAALTEKD